MKILVVEDDLVVQELLAMGLANSGYEVARAADPPLAMQLFKTERPDLAILDVNLERGSGFELLGDIRRTSTVPVIMLTGRSAEDDVLRGFELGANDYMIKPFHYSELLARIRFHLRDAAHAARPSSEEAVVRAGGLKLDPDRHSVSCLGRELDLTPLEFQLLHSLIRRVGKVVPNRVLLKEGWGYDGQSTEVIRATVHRLRHKLAQGAPGQVLIRTQRGIGLILEAMPET